MRRLSAIVERLVTTWDLRQAERPRRRWRSGPAPKPRPIRFEVLECRTLLSSAQATTVNLSIAPAAPTYGEAVTITAAVRTSPLSATTPTGGTVSFLNGITNLGAVTLTNGTASLTTKSLTAGTDVITAVYSGIGTTFAGSSSYELGSASMFTTIAGSGAYAAGYNGDNIAATAAELDQPQGVAVDAAGDIFIADCLENRVREIHAGTGIITTVAGTGTAGYNGDDMPAIDAELNSPTGLAVNQAGTDLYIADSDNWRIRKVDLTTGIITTVAGTAMWGYNGDGIVAQSAELFDPMGVAVDAAGDIFIADSWNSRIREVSAATDLISTVAGNGTTGYSGDNGPATAADSVSPRRSPWTPRGTSTSPIRATILFAR